MAGSQIEYRESTEARNRFSSVLMVMLLLLVRLRGLSTTKRRAATATVLCIRSSPCRLSTCCGNTQLITIWWFTVFCDCYVSCVVVVAVILELSLSWGALLCAGAAKNIISKKSGSAQSGTQLISLHVHIHTDYAYVDPFFVQCERPPATTPHTIPSCNKRKWQHSWLL